MALLLNIVGDGLDHKYNLTVESLVESKMIQIGVFWGLLENDDSNRKTERLRLSLKFETHFDSKTDWFEDLDIFQKLGFKFGGF